jgi:hypothetical protein
MPLPRKGTATWTASLNFNARRAPSASFVEVGLFDAFPGFKRLDLQVATPQAGQMKATLRRPQTRVALAALSPLRPRPRAADRSLRYAWPGAADDCLVIPRCGWPPAARSSCTAPAAAARAPCWACWPVCWWRAVGRVSLLGQDWATLEGRRA